MLAALVDLVIIAAGGFVLGFLVGLAGGDVGGSMNLIFLGWALYYYFAFESGDGQTPGKKLLKLRVVRADGGATSMREIAVRTVLRVIDGLFVYLVGLVTMLVSGQKRQRLGDMAAGTMVVDAGENAEPVATAAPAAVPVAPEVPEGAAAHVSPDATDTPDAEMPALEPAQATSPVDVGAPLPSASAPEQPPTPAVTEFNPFSEPAEPEQPEQHAPEPEPEPEPEERASEPQPDPEPLQVNAFPNAAAHEPQTEEDAYKVPAYEPEVEAAPEPVAEEAAFEAPTYEPEVEVAPEPVVEEAAFEAPAYEPQVEELQGPEVENVLEPVAEAPAPEVPAHDEQVEVAPEPAAEEEPADEQITMRPMDAPVSGMDLLMAEDEDDSPSDGEPPQGA